MENNNEIIKLTERQAACLQAIGADEGTKTRIAVVAGLTLGITMRILKQLEDLGFVVQNDRRRWSLTERAKTRAYAVIPGRQRRNSPLGATAQRLLDALDRPMTITEVAERLGVSRQRVHQLMLKLHARGAVRLGGQGRARLVRVSHVLARADDPTRLLSRAEARLLSVAPSDCPTTLSRLQKASCLGADFSVEAVESLVSHGLLEGVAQPNGEMHYVITQTGLGHPQYKPFLLKAQPPRLPVKSDRVFAVLQYMSEHGAVRILQIRDALRIPQQSMNALMQYLKRKGLTQKLGDDLFAPYTLSEIGRATLAELTRRRGAGAGGDQEADRPAGVKEREDASGARARAPL